MPSTQIKTPDVEAEVVEKVETPVKKRVEEKPMEEGGDVKPAEPTEDAAAAETDKVPTTGDEPTAEDEATKEDDESNNEENGKNDAADVDEVVAESEESENGKRKSLPNEAAESEVSPKKLKTDSEEKAEEKSSEEVSSA